MPAWRPRDRTSTGIAIFAPAGLSTGYFDLQIIRGLPQVKTPPAGFDGK
jgi:hypothetical protein